MVQTKTITDLAEQLQTGISTALHQLEGLRETLSTMDAAIRKRLGNLAEPEEGEDVEDEVTSSLEEAESMLEEAETSLEEASDFIEHALNAFEDVMEEEED